MAASSSSSSSKSLSSSSHDSKIKYDVFISFRGKDIRDTFLSHLLKELRRNHIDVYEDERLQGGDQISSSLLQAIQESFISLVIFSKHFASSKWCMEELLKILECMDQHHQIVIPVFYNVDPSDVRHQKRTFQEAFQKHEDKFKENVLTWRFALKKAADLSGFHYPSDKYKNESLFIDEIIKDVSEKLVSSFSSETKGLVGMDKHIECIESLLATVESKEVQILGIWGKGGIGKTTIAEVVFKKYSAKYEGSCFLRNVRQESEKHGGVDYLLQKLVSDLLQDTNILLGGLSTTRSKNSAERRLGRKRVFIVLDDVNTTKQLEDLSGGQICLGPGSKVIVTTRNKKIFRREHEIYQVLELSPENSMQLFCLNAFSQTHPEKDYEEQTKMAVDYANGIPLALKVLGSSLRSYEGIQVWESALEKLKLHLDMGIFNVLKWSYDELDDFEQNIFLDIAFFFKGKNKDQVNRILQACGFYPAIGIENLVRKALISVREDNNNEIEMHDLIEQMGWEIVRQESTKDPAKRSRLRNHEDVYSVLKKNKGSDSIEGIVLDLSKIARGLNLQADTFKKMPMLRVLIVYFSYNIRSPKMYLPTELESFSDELKYLEWHEYPLKSLPSSFCVEQLVELHMPKSEVSKLWDGVQDLVNLEILDLWGCTYLVELPDFTNASKLREIDLSNCDRLCSVHPSILCNQTLQVLRLFQCRKLKSLEGKIHFEYLHDLDIRGCSSLEEFSVTSEELRHLGFTSTKIDVLHSSIGRLRKLEALSLTWSMIKTLPNELCLLTSLKKLDLSGCTKLTDLPGNIKALTRLATLRIDDCTALQYLPELPSSLTALYADNCTSLQTIFFGVKAVSSFNWKRFSFKNCTRLDEDLLDGFIQVIHDTMMRCAIGDLGLNEVERLLSREAANEIYYPGSKVPEWFKYQTIEDSISVELDQPHHLLGFFFCFVFPHSPYFEKWHYKFKFQYYQGNGEREEWNYQWEEWDRGWNLDHVLIIYQSGEAVWDVIDKYRGSDNCSTHSQKISVTIVIKPPEFLYQLVGLKGCGFHPMYISDVRDFILKNKDVELDQSLMMNARNIINRYSAT